jgi:hypothetical protein
MVADLQLMLDAGGIGLALLPAAVVVLVPRLAWLLRHGRRPYMAWAFAFDLFLFWPATMVAPCLKDPALELHEIQSTAFRRWIVGWIARKGQPAEEFDGESTR